MFVKPAPGALVRDPKTRRPLPAEGAEVPDSPFWMRRLASGDCLAASPSEMVPLEQHRSPFADKE